MIVCSCTNINESVSLDELTLGRKWSFGEIDLSVIWFSVKLLFRRNGSRRNGFIRNVVQQPSSIRYKLTPIGTAFAGKQTFINEIMFSIKYRYSDIT